MKSFEIRKFSSVQFAASAFKSTFSVLSKDNFMSYLTGGFATENLQHSEISCMIRETKILKTRMQ